MSLKYYVPGRITTTNSKNDTELREHLSFNIPLDLYVRVVLLLTIFFSACKSSKVPLRAESPVFFECRLRDMLPKPMIRAILTDSLEANVPVRIMGRAKERLAGASMIINRAGGSIYLKSNKSGLVFINLTHHLLAENPLIRISYDTLRASDIRYSVGGKTMIFKDGKSAAGDLLEYENLFFIEQERLRLYYTTSKDTALAYMNEFINTAKTIRDILSIDDLWFVYPLLISNESISVVGEPAEVSLLPVRINSWQDMFWHFTHETVEHTLINKKQVYQKNPNLRFVGDGLAEYVALKVLTSKNPIFANEMLNSRIYSLDKSGPDQFSLHDWSVENERIEGYAYSLAFWLKAEEDHTPEKIKVFVKAFLGLTTYEDQAVRNVFKEVFSPGLNYNMSKAGAASILRGHLNGK